MSSTFFVENLNASALSTLTGNVTLGADLIYTNITNNLTVSSDAQATGTATASIPDLGGVSDAFVFAALTQTIGNKTIQNSTILANTEIADPADATKQVAFDIVGATTSTTTTLDFNQTVNRTITFPDATGTLGLQPSGTDDQIVRMDGTTGLQAGPSTLSDAGAMAGILSIAAIAATDLSLTTDASNIVSVPGNMTIGGNTIISGNLTVSGTTTSVDSTNVMIADNNLLLSSDYLTAVARAGGFAVNYEPTAIASVTAAGCFTATSVEVASAAGFAAGDIILVSGAVDPSNDGIFEILSIAVNVITIDPTPTFNFLNSVFTADATDTGVAVRKVAVAVLQAGTDGIFEVASGSSTVGMVFQDLATASGEWITVTFQTTDATVVNTDIATTSGSSQVLEVIYAGHESANGDTHGGKNIRSFSNLAATVSTVGAGSKDVSSSGDGSNWSVESSASGSNIRIATTGEAATTIDWKLLYRTTETE